MADDADSYESELDYRKLKETHETAGYREGLEAGEEATLQAGFDEGFMWGTSYSIKWAKLRGIVSALMSYVQSSNHHPSNKDELTGKLMEILEEAKMLEDAVNLDNLILTCEHRPSKKAEQSCRHGQGAHGDLEQNSCACASGGEDKNGVKEAFGTCCKEIDEKKSCTLDHHSSTTNKADGTHVENEKTLSSREEVENLLQKFKRVVGELGLDSDAILSTIKQDILHPS